MQGHGANSNTGRCVAYQPAWFTEFTDLNCSSTNGPGTVAVFTKSGLLRQVTHSDTRIRKISRSPAGCLPHILQLDSANTFCNLKNWRLGRMSNNVVSGLGQ